MALTPQPSNSLEVSPAKSRLSMLIKVVSALGAGGLGLTALGADPSLLQWALLFLGAAGLVAVALIGLPLVVGIFTRNDQQSRNCKYYFAQIITLFARRASGS